MVPIAFHCSHENHTWHLSDAQSEFLMTRSSTLRHLTQDSCLMKEAAQLEVELEDLIPELNDGRRLCGDTVTALLAFVDGMLADPQGWKARRFRRRLDGSKGYRFRPWQRAQWNPMARLTLVSLLGLADWLDLQVLRDGLLAHLAERRWTSKSSRGVEGEGEEEQTSRDCQLHTTTDFFPTPQDTIAFLECALRSRPSRET